MKMDGQAVFKFAVRRVPEVIGEVLEANSVAPGDISCYILHQANRRIVEAVAKRLGEPVEKFPMNLQEYGNTSSASIPILLDELNQSGALKKGQKIVLAGFGRVVLGGFRAGMVVSYTREANGMIPGEAIDEKKNNMSKRRMTMLEKIKSMVADNLGVEESTITEASSFKDDLGADSLDLFELMMALEEEFGVEIPTEDLEQIVTVGDVIKYVEAHK
ncbi:3-oxoacyl-[acyl-carrier-protein] synthase 3 [[Clostridium] hylemonae DSM 15053]|nr:3-oxoacyl-[acyl-carrier-protein] synthase 3 [[Clostridium] hylemonae DSM 15053]